MISEYLAPMDLGYLEKYNKIIRSVFWALDSKDYQKRFKMKTKIENKKKAKSKTSSSSSKPVQQPPKTYSWPLSNGPKNVSEAEFVKYVFENHRDKQTQVKP